MGLFPMGLFPRIMLMLFPNTAVQSACSFAQYESQENAKNWQSVQMAMLENSTSIILLPKGNETRRGLRVLTMLISPWTLGHLTANDAKRQGSKSSQILCQSCFTWKCDAVFLKQTANRLGYTPWNLTCPLKRDYFSRKYIHLPTIDFQDFSGDMLVFRGVALKIWRSKSEVRALNRFSGIG